MTDEEWRACTDPEEMVRFLLGENHGRWWQMVAWFGRQEISRNPQPSRRKLRLFACACCRPLLNLLRDRRSRDALEIAEQFADGQVKEQDLHFARANAWFVVEGLQPTAAEQANAALGMGSMTGQVWPWAARAAAEVTHPDAVQAAQATQAAVEHASIEWATYRDNIREIAAGTGAAKRAELLRDIFGPRPFRPGMLDPSCLTPTVVALAQAIYTDRAFDRLPVLADVLEEAGCTNQEILQHCRGTGPHVKGCWVVDLVLRKS